MRLRRFSGLCAMGSFLPKTCTRGGPQYSIHRTLPTHRPTRHQPDMGSVSDNFTTPIQPHHSSGAEHDEQIRILIDESVAAPTVAYLAGAMVWLVVGSLFGALASLKFNLPDLLSSQAILTFGRIRPAHLNTVVYGWVSLAGAGVTVWLMGRLCRAPIQWTGLLYASAARRPTRR